MAESKKKETEKDKRKDCLEKRMAQYQQILSYFRQSPQVQIKRTWFPEYTFQLRIYKKYFWLNISVGGDETF